ncbi:MAG: B12-binding domain-containing radical SAM protein [Deltaproteobacteria bacterium]
MRRIVNLLPPLGIGYIAALLEKNGFAVKIIDCPPLGLAHDDVRKELEIEKPQLVGITATTISIGSAMKTARSARSVLPHSLIAIGGPHVTALPEETMEGGDFDVAVIGEGEYSFLELAQRFLGGSSDFSGIRGLAYRRDGELVFTGERSYIENLDSLPYPAFHLFPPLSVYHPMPGNVKKMPYTQIMTSRGCPYQCTFCDRKVFGQVFRSRSPKNVVGEIEMLMKRFGIREVKFNDDTFNADPERAADICEEMLKRNLRIPWTCRVHINKISRELLTTMRRAGCWQIGFGIESTDPDILEQIKRPVPPEKGREAVLLAKKCGMNVKVSFMLGLPGENEKTIQDTIDFSKTTPADIVNFHIFIPFPGTELFRNITSQGALLHRNYHQYCQLNLPKDSRLPFVAEGLTEEQIRRASSRAHKSFYLRPAYIVSQLLQIRSIFDVQRYWKGFVTIIGL